MGPKSIGVFFLIRNLPTPLQHKHEGRSILKSESLLYYRPHTMAHDFETLLTSVGLLPSEARVYLAALELGPSTVQHIATKAKISRTAAYEAIELLEGRGLVTSVLRGKKRLYAAEDPERLPSYLKEEQQRLGSKIDEMIRHVEAMKLLAGGIRPTVRMYEGEEALHAFFNHIETVKPEDFAEISNVDDVYSFLDEKSLLAARKAYAWAGVKSYRLLHRGKLRNPRAGAEFCELPDEWGEFHGNIAIYEDFVTMVTYVGKLVSVIIESKTLADTMRLFFNMSWRMCSKTRP